MRKVIYLPPVIVFCLCWSLAFSRIIPVEAAASWPEKITAGNNSITGFVFDTSRRPVGNIYVELQSDLYSTLARTKTNGSGFFAFRGLSDGQYNVKVLPYATNFEEQSRSISLITISTGRSFGGITEQVDFYLQTRKDVNTGPLAAPGVIFAQSVPSEAKKYYEEGINFLKDKKEAEGFESLKRSLEIFPDYFLALDRLGTEYVVRGFYRPAYVLLTKAVEINPKSFSSTFGLGLTQYRLQEFDKAEMNLKRATELYNESINAYLWLGIVLHQNGKLSEAETSLLQAGKLSRGESPDVHWQLARLYSDQKRYREAVIELELFIKYNPKAGEDEQIKETLEKLRQKAASP